MKIRLCKNWLSSILAEREVPSIEIADGPDEFMINYDGYGFVLCMTCPTSCPGPGPSPSQSTFNPTLSHMYRHLTTNTQQLHLPYHTR